MFDILSDMTAPTDHLRRTIQRYVEAEGLHPLAARTGLGIGQIRSICAGRAPLSTTLQRACDALGLEFYVGPPRGGSESESSAAGFRRGGLTAAQLADLEGTARTLVRLVSDAGGDPIPAELRDALLGVAAEPGDADDLTMPFVCDVRAAAGAGEPVFEEAADLRVALPRSALPEWARVDGLICIRASGDSMEPTLKDGDLIVLDRTRIEPLDDQAFVAQTADGLVVKRLRREGGRWLLASDNRAYPPRPVGPEDRLAGRVAWSGPLGATGARADGGD